MFINSFEKTAGYPANPAIRRIAKSMGFRPKPVSEARINRQLARAGGDAKSLKNFERKKGIYDNLKDQSKAKEPTAPIKNERRLAAAEAAKDTSVSDPKYHKMKATERAAADLKNKTSGKPTALGRFARKHPVMTGIGTVAATKTVFGDKSQNQDQPPAVVYPNQNY